AMRITHVSSGLTTTQAWTSAPASAALCASADSDPNGRRTPRARPPAAAAVPTMKLRREKFASFMSRLLSAGRHMHRRADALIGAAPTDVGHRVVDVPVGRFWLLPQEGRRSHDLPRLAVAALWHVDRRPGLLHGVRAGGRQAFDGDDPVRGLHAADGEDAGPRQLAVDVHRAGAALRDAATILGACQADLLTDDPEQRRVRLHLHITDSAIDVELRHGPPPGAILTDSAAPRGGCALEAFGQESLAASAACAVHPTDTRFLMASSFTVRRSAKGCSRRAKRLAIMY